MLTRWLESAPRILGSAIVYNAVEVTLIAIVGLVHLAGGVVWAPVLWVAFAAAAIWTVLASTKDAQEDAKEYVLFREIFYTDFLIGAALLFSLGVMTAQYGLQYSAIFVLAAVQNLRYSALAYSWTNKDYLDDDSKRDNLP